jgi:hypothetical protein
MALLRSPDGRAGSVDLYQQAASMVLGYIELCEPGEDDKPRENVHEAYDNSTGFCVRALNYVRTCIYNNSS